MGNYLYGQTNLIRKQVVLNSSIYCFDERNIDWNTLTLKLDSKVLVLNKDYRFLDSLNCLKFLSPYKMVSMEYRTIHTTHLDSIKKKDRSRIISVFQPDVGQENNFNATQGSDPFNMFPDSKLNAYGNMSRGIGVGNNQNLVVNSNLNLQLNGDIGNDIELIAAISDESNPIQPEGNTQQLQDFDQVYLKFLRNGNSLTLGDFLLLNEPSNYFLKYNKKSRGLSYLGTQKWKNGELGLQASAAVSRGRFARNTIQGVEGNQGPYLLTGANQEMFILVLAGTERVYVDGKLLERGENHDYVIDYNVGEVTFTATTLITAYSRIIVEFQYSDRNYSRMMSAIETQYTKGKWTYRGGYFLEQDNKNQPFQQSLESYDSVRNLSATQILREAGDDPNLATLNSYEEGVGFNYDRVNYRRIDTLGGTDVYVYTPSPIPGSTYFLVSFSFVGTGNGNYKVTTSSANGRVYEYIAPVLGVPQGDYAPIIQLVSPVKNQLYSLGTTYKSGKGFVANFEFAGSDFDKNTFSNLDAGDDQGWAGNIDIANKFHIPKLDSTALLVTNVKYEHKNQNFTPIERYRSVEFDRQWERQLTNPTEVISEVDEDLFLIENEFTARNNLKIVSKFYTFLRKNDFEGISHELELSKRIKSIELKGHHGFTNSNNLTQFHLKNRYFEYGGELVKHFKKAKVGLGHEAQNSKFTLDTSSNLAIQSYSYTTNYAYLNLPFKETNSMELRGEIREDNKPVLEGLEKATVGKSLTLHFESNDNLKNQIITDFTYRTFTVEDSFASIGTPEDNLLSKVQYNFRWLKNSIKGNTFLSIGTGTEQRREYTYLEVPAGTGFYAWNDYNSNGIKELNEFEVSAFQDKANFIRVITPTNEFIKSNTNEFNQILKMQTPKSWNSKRGVKRFIGRFSSNSAWRLSRKLTGNDFVKLINPLENNIKQEALIYTKSFVKHTIFFNRLSPVYSLEVTTLTNKNKIYINNGFDSRNEQTYTVRGRINLSSKISFESKYNWGEKGFGSDFFDSRNFLYDFQEIIPSLNWVFNNKMRTNVSYSYFTAENKPEFGTENTENHDVTLQVVYNALTKGNIHASFSFTEVKYDGEEGNSLSYDMLQGLANGTNLTWILGVAKRFSNHLQLSMEYNGRQVGENAIVHVGSIQARYLF